MKKLVMGFAFLMCVSMFAQRNSSNDYWNSYRFTPKAGMAADFEAAVAKKMKMFNNSPETAMFTYRIVTGRNSGTYERVESMKYPKDYDIDRSAEVAHWDKNVSKFIERSWGQIRWDRINNATLNWDSNNPGQPAKYLERKTYDVKPSGVMHFRRFMYRTAKTQEKRGYKGSQLLFRCISGGSDNMYVRIRGWNSYQDDPRATDQSNTFREDYNELFGWGSFDEDRTNFVNSLEDWGEFTETMELVPSLTTGMMN